MPWYYYVDEALHRIFKRHEALPEPDVPLLCAKANQTSASGVRVKVVCLCPEHKS